MNILPLAPSLDRSNSMLQPDYHLPKKADGTSL
jgi:hypothetical protein